MFSFFYSILQVWLNRQQCPLESIDETIISARGPASSQRCGYPYCDQEIFYAETLQDWSWWPDVWFLYFYLVLECAFADIKDIGFALPDAALHTPANLCQVYIAFAVLNCSNLIQSRAGRLRLLGGDSGVVLPAIGPLSGPAPHFQLSWDSCPMDQKCLCPCLLN